MKLHHNYSVYILRCNDGSYYTGVTNNVERRVLEHQNRLSPACYTADRLQVELARSDWFRNVEDAIAFEKQVKGWSRKKKEALIRGDWNAIQILSRKKIAREQDVQPLDPSTGSGLQTACKTACLELIRNLLQNSCQAEPSRSPCAGLTNLS